MTSKRLFDLVCTALGLVVVSPVMLVIALLIKLDDGGPVFFTQERVGLRGRPFRMRKFRTMCVQSGPGLLLTVGEDPRITRFGSILRKLKLDELPQAFHVLTGVMTLVGPRPEVSRYVDHYTPAQRRVLDLVPGITDPASIRFWDEGELLAKAPDPERFYITRVLPEKIQIQLDYGERASLWTDFVVTLHTLGRIWPTARPLLYDRVLRHRRSLIILLHVALILLGYALAYELRFDFAVPPDDHWRLLATAPVLLALRLAAYGRYGLYQGYWQHFGLRDLGNLGKAVTISGVGFAVALWALGYLPGTPRSVLILDWLIAIFLSGGIRFAARSLRETQHSFADVPGRRTLVIGAGDKAEQLLRDAERYNRRTIRVLGLVADGPYDAGRTIHGVRVLGSSADLPRLVERFHAEYIVIAVDEAEGPYLQAMVERCMATGVECRILPTLQQVLSGPSRLDQVRDVRIEDLLGREPIRLDQAQVQREVRQRCVLISGAAGSIGSELARQIATFGPARLVLVDQAESPLYFTALELQAANPALQVVPCVCDITNESRLGAVFERERPEYVVHAAAYKHVPLMETHVVEAVHNNVVGTLVMARVAVRNGARKFVLISTDKAVNPSSVMGATKRIAERLLLELPRFRLSGLDIRVVRFGNVLGSNGSVIPLFERQLAAGGPLTVTDPQVERFFMTIPEAVGLVLTAAALPETSGRIAMLDMGQPVRIVELAEKLIRLSGREPYRDVGIVFTGLRPGEKLREELTCALEASVPTAVEQIRIMERQSGDPLTVLDAIDRLIDAIKQDDADVVLREIRKLVPECVAPLMAADVEVDEPMHLEHARVG